MKIELLKNKQTSIIEKIAINKGNKYLFSNIPFNLTHKQTMIELDEFELEWHERIMEYSSNSSIWEIRHKLFTDFNNNRELNYLIDLLEKFNKSIMTNKPNLVEAWFFNYYIWTMFYLISKRICPKKHGKTAVKVVDPAILFFAEGKEFISKYNVFYNNKVANQLISGLWNYSITNSVDDISRIFTNCRYNNEAINLEIFKKELLNQSNIKNKDFIFWNSKKKMIVELLIDLIDEKLHYINF